MYQFLILFICLFTSLSASGIPVRENGLVATLFLPEAKKPLPVTITLSGSNGGLSENRARLLALDGFATLALAYFGTEDLPNSLANINLEYFEKAFSWIASHPDLNESQICLYGVSRGAELALILGAIFPEQVHAIIASAPSSMIHSGFNNENAWLYQNKPISPFAKVSMPKPLGSQENPTSTLVAFQQVLDNELASIPVERIKADLLLITGGDDQVWPSYEYALKIERRAKNCKCRHLHYPKAGHGINAPNLLSNNKPIYFHPKAKAWFTMGGSCKENQRASEKSWKEIISFMRA